MGQMVLLQPCFVLHTRAYRETSMLITLFSQDYGRVDAVARGVRRQKSPLKGLLQPFLHLSVSWGGRGDLVTIKDAELAEQQTALSHSSLRVGFYLNELLTRLLMPHDIHDVLFHHYRELIKQLQMTLPSESALRQFEKRLLAELGFGLLCDRDTHGHIIEDAAYYCYQPEHGFLHMPTPARASSNIFLGKHLRAIEQESLSEKAILHDAKRLMRLAVGHLLQYKPIRSRDVFR